MEHLDPLRFPIGKFTPPPTIQHGHLQVWIADLAIFPQQLLQIATKMDSLTLNKSYRPGGWTVRQVIHHLADSHINAYMRIHLTLTEDKPTIRPYFEERWAELVDGKSASIETSIQILQAIHERMVFLLKSLDEDQFNRTYIHPETQQEYSLAYLVGNYAWHGKHHLAHITSTL